MGATSTKGTLVFYAGKMGAGKSTHAQAFARQNHAVLISEDEWLAALYPQEIRGFDDYIHYSSRLKPLVKKHIIELLSAGTSVVMDFPANTLRQREWFKAIIQEGPFPYRLIYLQADDQLCLTRLKRRRLDCPERAEFDNEAVFQQVTSYFQEPDPAEGLIIERISQ